VQLKCSRVTRTTERHNADGRRPKSEGARPKRARV